MSTVATISIKLDAQTAEMRKGFRSMQNESRSLSTQLKQSLGNGIVKINQAMQAGRIAIDAITGSVQKLMAAVEDVAALGDFADRIDISTDALQRLHLVTEQWGGAAGVMDTALQRMQRRIADAARAGGPLADRLDAVGLSVAELASLNADQQFLAVSDAVVRLGTAGEQTALVMALMDTEGVALTDTLRQGSEALREQMIVLGEHRTLTEAEIRAAQEAAANMKLLNAEWDVASTKLKVSLIPALELLISTLTKLADWFATNEADFNALFGVGQGGEHQVDPGFAAFQEQQEANLAALGRVMRGMKTYRKELTETAEAHKSFRLSDPLNIPGVGAVTSTSASGFSALQEGRRRAQQRAAWERDVLALLSSWREESAESSVDFEAVSIL